MEAQQPERYKAGSEDTTGFTIPAEIQQIDDLLQHFAERLRTRRNVQSVDVYPAAGLVPVFDWPAGGNAEPLWSSFGASARLNDGGMVDWWVEVRSHRPDWIIEYGVFKLVPHASSPHPEVEFSDRYCNSVEDFFAEARKAVLELIATEPYAQLHL